MTHDQIIKGELYRMTHRVLALDTANEGLAAAVGDPSGTLIAAVALFPVRNQAERLPGEVAGLLRHAGLEVADLTGLAVTVGPGGFSGVRVAAAYAHGIACALNIPAFGVSVHRVLAAGVKCSNGVAPGVHTAVVQHAGRGAIYAQVFTAEGREGSELSETSLPEFAATLPDGPLSLTGNAAEDLAALLPGRDLRLSYDRRVDAEALLRLYPSLDAENHPLRPLYVRAPDAKLPNRARPL